MSGKHLVFGARHHSAERIPSDGRSERKCIEWGWGVWAWWLVALALMGLRQKTLLEAIEFIQRQRATLVQSKQGL